MMVGRGGTQARQANGPGRALSTRRCRGQMGRAEEGDGQDSPRRPAPACDYRYGVTTRWAISSGDDALLMTNVDRRSTSKNGMGRAPSACRRASRSPTELSLVMKSAPASVDVMSVAETS